MSRDFTCAVTDTAIHSGDVVIMVMFNPLLSDYTKDYPYKEKYYMFGTYELMCQMQTISQRLEMYNDSKSDYAKMTYEIELEKIKLLCGNYDDYGFITQQEFSIRLDDSSYFMVHLDIWKAILDHEGAKDHELTLDNLKLFVDFCFVCRKQLFKDMLIGMQYDHTEERQLQIFTHKLAIKKLKEQEKSQDY